MGCHQTFIQCCYKSQVLKISWHPLANLYIYFFKHYLLHCSQSFFLTYRPPLITPTDLSVWKIPDQILPSFTRQGREIPSSRVRSAGEPTRTDALWRDILATTPRSSSAGRARCTSDTKEAEIAHKVAKHWGHKYPCDTCQVVLGSPHSLRQHQRLKPRGRETCGVPRQDVQGGFLTSTAIRDHVKHSPHTPAVTVSEVFPQAHHRNSRSTFM